MMSVLESKNGQTANNLADELDKHVMGDGKNILHALHTEGYLNKVETRHVVVEANSKSGVRLDELNKMLGEMSTTGIKDQAQELLKKGQALIEEAYTLDPSLKPKKAGRPKKTAK